MPIINTAVSRFALLLGFSALFATGAKASTPEDYIGHRVPQQAVKSFGELAIWTEEGRIYVSEAGKPAQELELGDTPEAARLRQLLESDNATGDAPNVVSERPVLAGNGGDGFHWRAAPKPDIQDATPPATSDRKVSSRARVLRERLILVGSGGDGFHWGAAPKSDIRDATPPATSDKKVSSRARVLRDRLILVGGGGAGFHWGPANKPAGTDDATNQPAQDKRAG